MYTFKISGTKMKTGGQVKYALDASIKCGETRVHDKCLRGSNKGITAITSFAGAAKIEQMFISHNRITTLNGIQNFKNLRVLSIAFNDISKISELRFLEGLNLETLNMEANPITKLPYYQHHVVALLPKLVLFDGKSVNDVLRAKAQAIVDFDTQRLSELCVNEARLAQMDMLLKNEGAMSDAKWKENVEKILDRGLTLSSFQMTEEEISDAFDKMRQVAVDQRKRQKPGSTAKWADIYSLIEDVQRKATEELSAQLLSKVRKMNAITPPKRSTPRSSFSSDKKKRSIIETQMSPVSAFSLLEKMVASESGQTPPTQMKLHENSNILSTSKYLNSSSMSSRSVRQRESESEAQSRFDSVESDATMPFESASPLPQKLPVQQQLEEEPSAFVEHMGRILEMTRRRSASMKAFWTWKCRFLRASKQVVILGDENGKLLEQAQEYITKISSLEAELDQKQKVTQEVKAALEESVKNEEKMKAIVQRMDQEKKALERSLGKSQKKYEEDVLQFILETKFKNDSSEARIAKLEAEVRKLKTERKSLHDFIKESQEAQKQQVDELNGKLKSAFDVASGFRREISKLKTQKSVSDYSYRSTKVGGDASSPYSPPSCESPGSPLRKRRNSIDFELRNC